jgi:hypothetical protein
VNEVVIPLKDKDRFNATKPTGDAVFLPYVLDPELARLFTLVHGIATPQPPRNDLVTVFLTGIPGLNQPANPNQVACEMLRLNLAIPPAAKPSRLGLLGGDTAGFPNGRRLTDDVVDIAERVVAGATPFTPEFNVAPNNRLGDGLDANDRPFLPYFPYVAPPHDPLDHEHHAQAPRGLMSAVEERAAGSSAGAERGSESPLGSALKVIGRNPASSSRLSFVVRATSHVSLDVFDLQGRKVRTLVDQDAAPGEFNASWNGLDDRGARVVRGVYFARLVSGAEVSERKIVME